MKLGTHGAALCNNWRSFKYGRQDLLPEVSPHGHVAKLVKVVACKPDATLLDVAVIARRVLGLRPGVHLVAAGVLQHHATNRHMHHDMLSMVRTALR